MVSNKNKLKQDIKFQCTDNFLKLDYRKNLGAKKIIAKLTANISKMKILFCSFNLEQGAENFSRRQDLTT